MAGVRSMRPTRDVLATLLIVLYAGLSIADIVDTIAGAGFGGACSVDIFGVELPAHSDVCYLPLGDSILFIVVTILAGIAFAIWPRRLAPVIAIGAAIVAITTAPAIVAEDDVLTRRMAATAILGSITILIANPFAQTARRALRRAWFAAIAVCIALGLFDMAFSGYYFKVDLPQVAFLIVALAFGVAGWLARKLDRQLGTIGGAHAEVNVR